MKFDINEFLKNLEFLVNTESASRDLEGLEKIGEYFANEYRGLNFFVKKIDLATGPCLIIKNNPEEDNDLLFVGHMDTVFPKGTTEDWPFSINEKEKKAFGPGVIDMKASLLLMVDLIKNLDEDTRNNINFCIILNPDEEISSVESKKYIIEEAKKSKFAFVFEPSRINGDMVYERKGLAKYEFTFKGKPAHAGIDPENGRSAITALAQAVVELDKLNDYAKGRSVNVGLIKGGSSANVVAENAEAVVDLRYVNDDQKNELEEKLSELKEDLGKKDILFTYKLVGNRPPMNASKASLRLIDLFNDLALKEGINLSWTKTGGGSDGNFTQYYGAATIDGIGPVGGYSHSKREFLEYDTVEKRLIILTKLIEEMYKEEYFRGQDK